MPAASTNDLKEKREKAEADKQARQKEAQEAAEAEKKAQSTPARKKRHDKQQKDLRRRIAEQEHDNAHRQNAQNDDHDDDEPTALANMILARRPAGIVKRVRRGGRHATTARLELASQFDRRRIKRLEENLDRLLRSMAPGQFQGGTYGAGPAGFPGLHGGFNGENGGGAAIAAPVFYDPQMDHASKLHGLHGPSRLASRQAKNTALMGRRGVSNFGKINNTRLSGGHAMGRTRAVKHAIRLGKMKKTTTTETRR
ncbi:hypothetical protein CTRI78_v008963 [Colletotrichum trifolii]|uniref:Uncharacterized protein n=1 Tax=Colletotrichum trifolii TaxID=5466 RepID=A0A4R8R1U7_COLTR|nr:hypothetical protein CTRI78_v008963 [Colletotrichum trifolii]